ncbi:hypothetical protein [Plasmodium yoelii yoelii]|uniref:Uncharacterized protein n=1 Tax=Plasmodium yoelii yoelii TaxID=73239 RepID=Q7RFL6_PLAYO|nr:hypothetical protein [Plasmodium yoelii yoelii]
MFDIVINGTRRNESQILGKSQTTNNEYGLESILPLYVLTPIFFADPIAAIVGQYFSKLKIYKIKTVSNQKKMNVINA